MVSGGFVQQTLHALLTGGGELAELIAAYDWASTGLGPVQNWPSYVQTTTALMLRCNVPMVMLWGEPGVMVYNDAYAAFAGTRHPGLLGAQVRDAWSEVAAFNDNVMKAGLAGQTLSYRDQELTLNRHGRDEQVWLNLDYSPLLDESGKPAGVVALVVETTAKILAERGLDAQRTQFVQLFQQAPTFMTLLTGPRHRIELANPNYLKLIGNRDVIGRDLADALPDAAAQGFVKLLDDVYATGKAYSATGAKYDAQAIPGGPVVETYVDLVFQPLRDTAGNVTGIFVEGVDVSARVKAEARREALATLTDRWRDVEDPRTIAYLASETIGQTLQVSRAGFGAIDHDETLSVQHAWSAPGIEPLAPILWLQEYGSLVESLKRSEVVRIEDVREDARTASASAALEARKARAVLNVPVVERGELVAVFYLNHHATRAWADEDVAFVEEVASRTRTAVERARAVSALRESEAQLREANETLESRVAARTQELLEVQESFRQAQKMEAIGQLTGGIAHDFNNLLGTMMAGLQVIQKRVRDGRGADAERYLSTVLESVRRAASLTQRLLAFSRRQTLDPRPTDVNRLIGGLEDFIRRTAGPTIALEVVGAGGLWPSKIDAGQLENAILNLCINARDAMMPNGGRLTIETANKWLDEKTSRERDLPGGQYISICVTDTGSGMTPDVVSRAFDPFFTTKPAGQGTGLGLSMVYGFVRQSGGQVRVYSEVGAGTTICLYLPRAAGENEAAGVRVPEETKVNATGEQLLVVEDEEGIREILSEELGELGYAVTAVANGTAAIAILQSQQRIDLLITDVGLPGGVNGRQVADAGRISRPELKVLFMTGYAENAAVRNGLVERGMAVVTKPFDIDAMALKIREMLDRQGA